LSRSIDFETYTLTNSDVTNLDIYIKNDRDGFFLNALISYTLAIKSIISKNYSWAIVKLYYTIFYAIKTKLALSNRTTFYHNSKLYSINNTHGSTFKKLKGTSHEAIFKYFSEEYPRDLFVASPIDSQNPFEWFKEKREYVNYKVNPMEDPLPYCIYDKINDSFIHWINEYLTDEDYIYTFDNEHAYLAYPTKMINNIIVEYEELKDKNKYLNTDNYNLLRDNLKHPKQPISSLINRITSIYDKETSN
jgi:uncharacterized protein (UPF0332 family)